MFGQWRLTLRQAEEAVRAERFEEALDLARRPELADHRLAGKLRERIALRLIDRARQQLRLGQSHAAWQDLREAERAGAPGGQLAEARSELTERASAEIRSALDACDPRQAIALIQDLQGRGVETAEVRRLHEVAACWLRAQRFAELGSFSRAIECLETARRLQAGHAGLDNKFQALQANNERAGEIRSRLQKALAGQCWSDILREADAFLELAPDCREVKQARDEALRRLGVRVASTSESPIALEAVLGPHYPQEAKGSSRSRFILWLDGVGGFLVCQGNAVTLGHATPSCTVDIPILGDLSRQHATIVRDGEGYLVRSDRELHVNGRSTNQSALTHGDAIRLGRTVELRFWIPSPMSATARLDLLSPHRLQLSLGGILLMAETCVIGPSTQAHVRVMDSTSQVVLFRQNEGLGCRYKGTFEIDNQSHQDRGSLRWTSRVIAGDLSFSLEPLVSLFRQV